MIVNCARDPGVARLKRVITIPVIGTKESSRALASLISKRAASIYPTKIPVLDLENDVEATYLELLNLGRKKIKQGADLILLGCTILDYHAQRLQADLGVPVLRNCDSALKLAELLVAFGVHSTHKDSPPLITRIAWFCRTLFQKGLHVLKSMLKQLFIR